MKLYPRSEAEIVAAVRRADREGKELRVVGSRHSVPSAYQTDGISLSLDRYDRIIKVQGCHVTVESGMRVQDLARFIDGRGFALPNLGGITVQTVAGFLSTGSEGGSLEHAFSASLSSMRIVTANGEVVEVGRDHPWFDAVGVSMGLLGVISTVTFECIPSYGVAGTEFSTDVETVSRELSSWTQESAYCRVLWYPGIDHCDVWRAQRIERCTKTTGVRRMSPFVQHAANAINFIGTRARGTLARPLWKLFTSSVSADFSGRWYEVLPQDEGLTLERLPHLYSEIFVPFERTQDVIEALRRYFQEKGVHSIPALPVEFYCSPAKSFWLSPAYHRESLRVNLIHYAKDPKPPEEMYRGLWERLEPFDARAHWGKYHLEADAGRAITRNYPRWNDFMELREQLDPNGIFLTPYWERLMAARKNWGEALGSSVGR